MKKQTVIVISIIGILLTLVATGYFFPAGAEGTELNAVGVSLNGSRIKIDTIVDQENVYVPIDQICHYLKCGYEIDDAQKKINFLKTGEVPKAENIDNWGEVKKTALKIEAGGYQTMLDDLLLFIEPVVYDNTFYIHLKHLAESFEMETKWGFSKKTVKVTNYPVEYVGSVNGEKIKGRFFRERYLSKLVGVEENLKKRGKKLSASQKKHLEAEAFNETVELVLASQLARENGIVIDEKLKKTINWYLDSTVSRFGGIDKLRKKVEKQGAAYQDGVNYFTYGVLMEEVKRKLTEGVKPSQEMMIEYYTASEKTFIHPAEAIVQHIIIPTKDKDENSYDDEKIEEQRKLAYQLMDRIKAGEDFEVLRKKYSVDYFADTAAKPKGFEVIKGRRSIARVFEDAVFALEPGQISDVVKTYRGFHIIKLISKTEESPKTFGEAQEKISKDLEYTAKTNYFNDLMQTRKEESVIEKLL